MANLMVICGPQAVGKMTVAESVQNKTDYKLMTNHDSIEVSGKIFQNNIPIVLKHRNYNRARTNCSNFYHGG